MNLLLDENLSPRLVARLASLFPGLIHVRDIGLKPFAFRNWLTLLQRLGLRVAVESGKSAAIVVSGSTVR